MGIGELLLIALSLAMDAFAVSVCKGLSIGKITVGNACRAGLWFGVFQALMPLAGWFLGAQFLTYIEAYDHWIACALLTLIGGNMILDAVREGESCTVPQDWLRLFCPWRACSSEAGSETGFSKVQRSQAALF